MTTHLGNVKTKLPGLKETSPQGGRVQRCALEITGQRNWQTSEKVETTNTHESRTRSRKPAYDQGRDGLPFSDCETIRCQETGLFNLSTSAHIKRRQTLSSVGEAGVPLRCVLADNGAGLPVFDTQGLGRVELAADELGCGVECLTEGTEEGLARPVGKDEARIRSND